MNLDSDGNALPAPARRWTTEPVLAAHLRRQVAVLRALLDQVEQLPRDLEGEGLPDQLIEELARLGCSFLEQASSLAASRPSQDSGIFERPPSS